MAYLKLPTKKLKVLSITPFSEVLVRNSVWKASHANPEIYDSNDGPGPDALQDSVTGELVHDEGRLHAARLLAGVWHNTPGQGVSTSLSRHSHTIQCLHLPDKVRISIIQCCHQSAQVHKEHTRHCFAS